MSPHGTTLVGMSADEQDEQVEAAASTCVTCARP